MTPSIPVSESTKAEWDKLKEQHEDDLTHDEFAEFAIRCIRRDNGEVVNTSEIVDDITKQTAAEVELASYRGTRSALRDLKNGE